MNCVTFRFIAELNDFLPISKRKQDFQYHCWGNPSVKHLIEALRVPHTEVGKILVFGKPVDFSYLVKDGDRIEVYPPLSFGTDRKGINLQKAWSERPRFLLDNHLGKLATYLRILGFDVLYRNDYQDKELVDETRREERILLTRDRGLLMHRAIKHGYCVRNLDPKLQLVEVMHRFNLQNKIQPFQRCLRCNSLLQPVKKEVILDRLKPLTCQYYEEFHICRTCNQIYWKGSHYERMELFLKKIKENN